MSKRTVRANARTMPETQPAPAADIQALAANCEAAWGKNRARPSGRTDEEVDALSERQEELAKKVAALPSSGMSTMRLKARVYMRLENAYDLEEFADVQHDMVSGPVLVSLFRDLGAASDAEAAIVERVRQRYFRPGALERGLEILRARAEDKKEST